MEQRLNKLKHTNTRITQMIILLPKTMSQVQVKKNDYDKNHKLKHTNRRITHMVILLTKRMGQVQVTAKIILMNNIDINTENQ